MSTTIQFLTDEKGNRTSAVIPIQMYEQIMQKIGGEEELEALPYVAGDNDDETIPHEVLKILRSENSPLHVAWRIYRGYSQLYVAEQLGLTQSGVSKLESRNKPHKATLEKLAALYDCRVTQLYF